MQNEESLAIDDLCDRLEYVTAAVELQGARGDAETVHAFERLAFLQRSIHARNQEHGGLPFAVLASRLALSETEVHAMSLLVGIGTSVEVRKRLGRLIGNPAALTIDALRMLVYGSRPSRQALDELSSAGTLRRLALIERDDDGGPQAHESKQTWVVSRRVVSFLHGDMSLECQEAGACRSSDQARTIAEIAAPPEAVRTVCGALTSTSLLMVTGMPGAGRRTLLRAVAEDAGIALLQVDARKLAKEPAKLTKQLRAIARECKLLARTLLVCNLDALVDDKEDRLALVGSELVSLVDGLVLVTCGLQRPRLDWNRPVIVIELEQPTSAQRAKLWHAALGQGTEEDAQLLATQYPLAPALIHRAAEAAKVRAGGRPLEPDDIFGGIRTVLDDRLGQFAKRVTVTQIWQDLVLGQEQVDAIVELMARIRERRRVYEDWGFAAKVGKGLGVSALFSGPPGTGKTMVAALIARDLGLELYQVDLSKIVSKYIGETEKQLAGLFDAAEAGHAILLFDEADSLFGKRTDVKSSNDRYANLETNYLLQRLESFTGICLLTSNHESHIDVAFQRRLSLHLRFELPDADERTLLWRAMLPEDAPVSDDLDVEALGRRFAMSGGYIRNAALRAAFLAAHEGKPISAAHLERAAQREYEGMGKIASP